MKEEKALWRAHHALLAAQRKTENDKARVVINLLFTQVQTLLSLMDERMSNEYCEKHLDGMLERYR